MNPIRFGAVIKFIGSTESTYYRANDFKSGLDLLKKPVEVFPYQQENENIGHVLLTGQDAIDYRDLTNAASAIEDQFRKTRRTQEVRHAYTNHPNAMTIDVDQELPEMPLED